MNPVTSMQQPIRNETGGVLLVLLGLVLAATGIAFSLIIGVLLFEQFQSLAAGPAIVSHNQLLYEGLWFLFSASLAVLGLSLMVSGFRGRRHDVVPGPTLYVMGASLMAIALMMAMYGQVLQAVVAALVGLTLMIIEWYYDVV